MVNWMDSIIERIWFSGMVRRECIRFIYILFPARQVLFVVAKLTFQVYNKATLSQTVFNEFCFLRGKGNEGRKEGSPKPSSIYTQIFYPFLSPKFLQDRA